MKLSRRDFIRLSSLAGASLVLETGCVDRATGEPFAPSEWLTIHPGGPIELVISKMEMGQGIRTGLALIVAEELEIDPRELVLEIPSVEGFFARGVMLHTGSSMSTASLWDRMRWVGAVARHMLTAAAARKWEVPMEACRADNGTIRHDDSGRSLTYGELAVLAAQEEISRPPVFKEPSEFRWMGHATPRLEGPDIVTGVHRYGGDIRLEGQPYAVLARPPVKRAKLRKRGRKKALAMDGVVDVLRVKNSVAVVADTTWSALEARDKLKAEWRPGPGSEYSTEGLQEEFETALDAPPATAWRGDFDSSYTVEVRSEGDAPTALGTAGPVLESRFSTPFHAHMPMEPKNALVRIVDDRCDIWAGTQHPNETARRVAGFLKVPNHQVVIHPQFMGGAFGQKEPAGFIVEAVAVARAIGGGPVHVFWSREDDLAHDHYHPPSRHRLQGTVTGDGRIGAWRHRVALPSIEKHWQFGKNNPQLVPRAETAGAWNMPYAPENLLVEYVDPPNTVPLGFWRGVELVPCTFAVECFVDELAHAAGIDPLEFRLRNLDELSYPTAPTGEPPFQVARLARAIEMLRERSDWGSPMPPGHGRGMAALVFDGRTACASVAEVSVADGELRVQRFVTVIDCGFVVNPLGVAGSAESSITWGLSALFSEITFKEGQARETSHVDYPILRFPEMPRVEVHTVPSDEKPSGAGEIPVPSVAPAVANAIYAATGRRIRHLPIRPGDLSAGGPS